MRLKELLFESMTEGILAYPTGALFFAIHGMPYVLGLGMCWFLYHSVVDPLVLEYRRYHPDSGQELSQEALNGDTLYDLPNDWSRTGAGT